MFADVPSGLLQDVRLGQFGEELREIITVKGDY